MFNDEIKQLLEKLVEQGGQDKKTETEPSFAEAAAQVTAEANQIAMERLVTNTDRIVQLLEDMPEIMAELFANELEELGNK